MLVQLMYSSLARSASKLLPGRDFFACSSYANNTRLSPTAMGHFQGGTHNIDVASTVKSVIIAPLVPFKQLPSSIILALETQYIYILGQ